MKYTEYVPLAYVLQKREQTYRRPSKTPPSTPRIREAFHRNIPSLESQQHCRRILFGSASKRGSVGKARAALCAAGARARGADEFQQSCSPVQPAAAGDYTTQVFASSLNGHSSSFAINYL
jgi:hypothetical protein